ncbi:unnamed protein product [Umbelopsis ramanniana]
MMQQEEMIKYWPPEVTDMIITLAGQRMATNDIRQRVQARFPEVPWNERRFYNRITEERKRTRYRETTDRVHRLTNLSVRLCSVAAGAEDMAVKVEAELKNMLKQCCDYLKVSPETIVSPIDFNQKDNIADEMSSASPGPKPPSKAGDDDKLKGKAKGKAALRQTASSSSLGDGDDSGSKKRKLSDIIPKVPEGVKGSLPVVVPSYTLYIKSESLKKVPSDLQQHPSESNASQTMTSQDNMELDSSQSTKMTASTTRAQRRSRARNSLQSSSQEHHHTSPHLQAPHLPPPPPSQPPPPPPQSFTGGHLSHPMSAQQNHYMYHTFPVPPAVRTGDPQSMGNQDARYGMSSPIPTYGMNQEFSSYSMQPAFSSHSMQYGFPPGSNIPQGLHPAMIPGTDTMLPDKQQTPNGRQSIGDSQQMYVFDVQHPSNNSRQE